MFDPRGKECPKCGRKGLHFADHPHAYGYKEYGRLVCRFCKTRFITPGYENEAEKQAARTREKKNVDLDGDKRPAFCRPEWGCRYCKPGQCEWDRRQSENGERS